MGGIKKVIPENCKLGMEINTFVKQLKKPIKSKILLKNL